VLIWARLLALRLEIRELRGTDNCNPAVLLKNEQVFVCGYDALRVSGDRRTQHHVVIGVTADGLF
jgi:hypothetical protein